MKIYLQDMTWEEVRDRAKESDVAVMSTGSNEQHGIHLPLKTDIFIASEVARRGAEAVMDDVKPIVAPPIPYGWSPEHIHFPGTVTLSRETFINLVKDVLRSLIRSGFRKVVIVNGHGSNPFPLNNAMVDVKQETDAFIVVLSWWELAMDEIRRVIETPFNHACELETSMILGLDFPVDMKKAIGEIPPSPLPGFSNFDLLKMGLLNTDLWGIFSVSKTGAIGDPSKGTAEKGSQVLKAAVDGLTRLLRTVHEKKPVRQFSDPVNRLG